MDGIFEIMALFEHFLEPGRRIGCEEQALLVAAPKVDIVKQREPAEAKIAHGGIDRAMQIAKGFSTLTVRRKAREIIKRSEEHTSELQSLMRISYAVFCLT